MVYSNTSQEVLLCNINEAQRALDEVTTKLMTNGEQLHRINDNMSVLKLSSSVSQIASTLEKEFVSALDGKVE